MTKRKAFDVMAYPNYLEACKKVANDWRELAHATHKEFLEYATANNCDTLARKESRDNHLKDMLSEADNLDVGIIRCFTLWQRVYAELSGKCVGFLGNGDNYV